MTKPEESVVGTGAGLGPAAMLRLLHLCSPALPIGAFAHSQGLEQAVELGWVTDEPSAAHWIHGLLEHAVGTLDVPVLLRLHAAWSEGDADAVRRWNDFLFAARGSRELQEEDRRVGGALARALVTLGVAAAAPWATDARTTYPTLFGLAAVHWEIPAQMAGSALLFAWTENQAAAAMRLVPLGQSSGLRLIATAADRISAVVARAATITDEDIGTGAPAAVIASVLHETQYSRIFRS